MAESDENAISRFHQVVENGSLDDLRAALRAGAAVDAPGHCGTTALMVAIAAKDAEKMHLLLDAGADPEFSDDFNATALRHAVNWDFYEGVQLLLSLGVDRGYSPKYPLKKVVYDYPWTEVPLPEEMKGILSEEEWKQSQRESQESIRELGESPTVEPMIADVQSVEVLRLFLSAGDQLQQASREVKRKFLGLATGGEIECSPAEYRRDKTPRYGTLNPERIENPFWKAMIRTGDGAYAARKQFGDTDSLGEPVWCFERFGSSITPLPDGRFVQIGGEHEDFYDPDFCIYNDVVVHDGRGGFEIYGHPAEVFPPTDFHSATLVDDNIYVIGCLGYVDQRRDGFTPVHRLNVRTWQFEEVATRGEMPGWIYEHRAHYLPARRAIAIEGGQRHLMSDSEAADLVANVDCFELDLATYEWRKVA